VIPDSIGLVEISDLRMVDNSTIRDLVQNDSPDNKRYVAYEHGDEVAFLSIFPRPDLKIWVIYKMFVLPELRWHGIGTRLLLAAEELGRNKGFPKVRLTPKALGYPDGDERDRETAKLIAWYERHGYRATQDSRFREWQKELQR